MHIRTKVGSFLLMAALCTAGAGCGSSPSSPPNPDSALPAPSVDAKLAPLDAAPAIDVAVLVDTKITAIDAAPGIDVAVLVDTQPISADATPLDDTKPIGVDANLVDDAATDAISGTDGATEGPVDSGFVPGPATAIVVNSGPTGLFNLSDGTWKVFYFDTVADQIYLISELSGIVRGYVSTSPSVSPRNYQLATSTDGNLFFAASAAQRYYVAVAVSGGGASGSFQVADGGKPIALGSSTLILPAPIGSDTDSFSYYRFPITSGHGYRLDLTGPSQPELAMSVSPYGTRSLGGELSGSSWGVGGSLPFNNEIIPAESVANSFSGFYYLYFRVQAALTLTITITQTP
jgi:hypothetical protein